MEYDTKFLQRILDLKMQNYADIDIYKMLVELETLYREEKQQAKVINQETAKELLETIIDLLKD